MNRDQAKSKAFSERKRGEVEDGTADKTRKEKARDKGLELEKLIGFKSIDYPEMDVGPLLKIIAQERGHVPVSDKFLARLSQELSDWLKLFVHSPYTTSPKHPALKKCRAPDPVSTAREVDSETFQVYIRTYE